MRDAAGLESGCVAIALREGLPGGQRRSLLAIAAETARDVIRALYAPRLKDKLAAVAGLVRGGLK